MKLKYLSKWYLVSCLLVITQGQRLFAQVSIETIQMVDDLCYSPSEDLTLDQLLTLNGDDPDEIINGLQVAITLNYTRGVDFLTFTSIHGVSGSFDAALGILKLSGAATLSQYREVIQNVIYRSAENNADFLNKEITVILSDTPFFVENGHFYEYFPQAGVGWDEAEALAKSKELFGVRGYLATITTRNENEFILEKVSGTAWIGANDEAVEGDWRWVTGPEGREDGGRGRRLTLGFQNWNTGEPNDCCNPNVSGQENYAHIFDWSTPPGRWNDLVITGDLTGRFVPTGYIVEYGGQPGDPVIDVGISGSSIIEPTPSLEIVGTTSVCPNIGGVSYVVEDISGFDLNWIVTGGTLSSGQGSNEITVDWGDTNAGARVSLIVTSAGGCVVQFELDVVINEQLNPPIPMGSTFECFLDLAGPHIYSTPQTNGSSYDWKINGGTILSGQGTNEVQVQWNSPGTGMIWFTESTSTSTDICDGDSPQLSVELSSEIVIAPQIADVSCFGGNDGTISLTITGGNAPYDVSWTTGQNGLERSLLRAGIYTVNVVDAMGCEVTQDVEISEPEVLEATLVLDHVLCFGEANGQAELIIEGGTSPYQVFWDGSTTDTGPIRDNMSAGTYSVKVVDSQGCELVKTVVITEPELLTAVTTDSPTCANESTGSILVEASGGTRPYTYRWNTSPPQDSQLIKGLPAGKYSVTVTDANGCTFTFEDEEIEEKYPLVQMPNAFSPNGDGQNDSFMAVHDCAVNFQMKIFSKWGEIIFHTKDIAIGWDGYYKGQSLPGGTYTYVADYSATINGQTIHEIVRGKVKLFR